MRIPVGMVLVFETGEYSDYSFTGPFRVLREFDQAGICEVFTEEWHKGGHDPEWDHPEGEDLIAWLSRNGYVEDIPHISWHVGSYGRLEPEIQEETKDAE